jgi:ribonuclease P protein component
MQRRLRLRRSEDFQRIRKAGRTWAHPYLILGIIPNELPHNRYGIITTRRLGNAVARNRAKRRIREAIRSWHPQITPGYDMILIARYPVMGASFPALLEAVELLLHRANLVINED